MSRTSLLHSHIHVRPCIRVHLGPTPTAWVREMGIFRMVLPTYEQHFFIDNLILPSPHQCGITFPTICIRALLEPLFMGIPHCGFNYIF